MFDYKSPINVFQTQFETQLEGEILKAVHKVGVHVDKDELVKVLKNDREQYEKGYDDGFDDGFNANKWIPCSERLPNENGKYLATGIKGSVYIAEFYKGVLNGKPVSLWCRSGGHYCNVIAWMELPPAYKGGNRYVQVVK